ncbi:MAG: outer membrane protein assembly factor BamA [Gemmatimonadetes bacterium]|nr:outer membrane protein assembly factor BamA [Gemmatimonadota bacterium]MYA10243.1 outer membrane protein assembly factor BamA [Gemmatimonadota bacterium]MYD12173.1 outer membrane protein assembly factor BamA [Gemmatimonadota bacterium]MYE70964.1 outer membrane protein assembly factor BamA [Gemmatimonadota bacterium]MYI65585.1 outer membrane protein assembly factor BamA [Gemmatimonadota bacterium]
MMDCRTFRMVPRWIAAAAVVAATAPVQLAGQVSGQDALVRIDSLVARGMARLTQEEVIGEAGIQPGTTNSWIDIQRAIKNLWATGLYEDVAFRLDESSGRNVLIIDIVERPLARYIRITGLETISQGKVFDEVGLRENAPLSRNSVLRAETFIREELRREGVPFAVIRRREQPVPGEDGKVDVVIDVEEGQRVTIAQVTFAGNAQFSGDELRGAMRTKPEGFFWFRTGNYDDIDFELDLLESLPAHYSRSGYLDFQVLGDTLIVDPLTGKARLEIQVDEGPQYRLAELEITGADAFDAEMLREYFESESGGILSALGIGRGGAENEAGQVFDLTDFQEAAQRVHELYSNEGYLYAQVDPFYEPTGEEVGGFPTVRAQLLIEEGPQAYVRNVIIQGNDYTFDRVIREKIFVLPGDVYSQARIIQSYQNIQSLGFFETPMPAPDIRPDPVSGDVDIIFTVVEKQTGTMSFGTAVGGGVGLSGFIGFDQPNLLGQGKAGSIRWDFGRYINSFTLSLTDPALFQSTISGSFSVYNSTDRFFQFATGRRRRAGFTTQFGVPFFSSLQTRVFFGYSLSRTSYEAFNSAQDRTLFGLPPGILSSFSVGITRNTMNHPLFPTSGSMQTWNVALNGGPLGGQGNFIKHTGQAQWRIPLGQLGGGDGISGGTRFALGLTVRGGALFGDASRFPFESFWLGGVQFGEPLRGYDETSITPFGYFPDRNAGIAQVDRTGNAYFSATAEYAAVFGSNIGVAMFYDAGNLWQGPGDLNTSRLYRGAGFGVQLLTPFGPLGLDYAYGFDKRDPATGLPAPGWQLHFKMGPNF